VRLALALPTPIAFRGAQRPYQACPEMGRCRLVLVAAAATWNLSACGVDAAGALVTNEIGLFSRDLLREDARACELSECDVASFDGGPLLFSCEASNDRITAVTATRAAEGEESHCPGPGFRLEPDATCAKAIQDVELACLGKVSCEIEKSIVQNGCGDFDTTSQTSIVVKIRCGEVLDTFTLVAYVIQVCVGIGLGATLEVKHVTHILKHEKRAVLIGFGCQFGIMPLLAFSLAKAFQFEPLVAVGVILCGACPGGQMSNLLSYFAKASVGLSLVMTSASVFASLFMLPLLIFVYGTLGLGVEFNELVPFKKLAITLAFAVVPSVLGVWVRYKSARVAKVVERVAGFLGSFMLLGIIISGILDNTELLDVYRFKKTWTAAACFFPIGASLGYFFAQKLGLSRVASRAVSLETGLQNISIAIAVIATSFQGCDRGTVLTFPLVSGFVSWCWAPIFVWVMRYIMAPKDPVIGTEQGNGSDKDDASSSIPSETECSSRYSSTNDPLQGQEDRTLQDVIAEVEPEVQIPRDLIKSRFHSGDLNPDAGIVEIETPRGDDGASLATQENKPTLVASSSYSTQNLNVT